MGAGVSVIPQWAGFIACALAVICFSLANVPVKKFDTGDGFFFQFVYCSSIFFVGFFVQVIRGNPLFSMYEIMGGMLWTLGFIGSFYCIKLIGLGVGMSTWCMIQLVLGWATGNFGLFGLIPSPTSIPWLSYVGVVLACCAVVCFIFIDPNYKAPEKEKKVEEGKTPKESADEKKTQNDDKKGEATSTIDKDASKSKSESKSKSKSKSKSETESSENSGGKKEKEESSGDSNASEKKKGVKKRKASEKKSVSASEDDKVVELQKAEKAAYDESTGKLKNATSSTDLIEDEEREKEKKGNENSEETGNELDILKLVSKLTPKKQKIVGFSLTVFCGMCFSQVFTPAQWEMDNIVTSSKSGIDYVFGMYSGIMLTSTLIFAIYCAITKNRPRLHREMILGAMGGGFLWAVAQTMWFVANAGVSLTIAFPLISLGAPILGAIWGIILFKENRGKKNIIFLSCAAAFGIVSVVCTTLSKVL